MNCQHLKYRFLFVCMSEGVPYVPEIGHVRAFCRGPRLESCPFKTGSLKKLKPAAHAVSPAATAAHSAG